MGDLPADEVLDEAEEGGGVQMWAPNRFK